MPGEVNSTHRCASTFSTYPEAKQFSTKLLSRKSGVAECAIRVSKERNTIKPRTLRKLTKAIHNLQNKEIRKL
ncbi:MAG: hypothetical protein DMG80_20575 [Acidobacteria bacterium]|nr:MAG: hypothetical protein DMG80_20575 [Acidobacteriota bacterium]